MGKRKTIWTLHFGKSSILEFMHSYTDHRSPYTKEEINDACDDYVEKGFGDSDVQSDISNDLALFIRRKLEKEGKLKK